MGVPARRRRETGIRREGAKEGDMREVSIIGVGIHPWGKFREKTFVDMGVAAVSRALSDAAIDWREIQTVCSGI